jgi:methionine-gamma-lyase
MGFTTRALNPERDADALRSSPLSEPIYQAATFAFDDMEHFASVAKTKTSGGYLYSRWANPTVDALGRIVASLEGAEAAACFASGMGAIHSTLTALTAAGDHVVSASQLYGGTHSIMARLLPGAGVETTLVDVTDHDAVVAAFRPETRVLYCETIGNPTLPVADLDALAAIAHDRGALVVVDSTFTPPSLLRPLAHGVDVSLHSATKYIGGHSDVTAGVVSASDEIVQRIRMHAIDTGPVLAPVEAWLTARGVQTMALRVERICANALALARMFEAHEAVERVHYPKLESHPQYDLARRLLPRGAGGMIAIEVAGGVEGGRRVMERVRVAKAAASLGSNHTLVVHPASVTHTQLTRAQRESLGITDGMLRVSVGIEDQDDLLADFEQALA